jgi:hypothetical protein
MRWMDGSVSGQSLDYSKHLSCSSSLLPIWFLTTHLSDLPFSFISCFHNPKGLSICIQLFSNHFWKKINQKEKWFVHENIEHSVDFLLQKQTPFLQSRILKESNKIVITQKILEKNTLEDKTEQNLFWKAKLNENIQETKNSKSKIYIYSYSVSIDKIQQICKSFNFNVFFTKDIYKANAILALKSYLKENKKLRQIAKIRAIPIYTIKKNTPPQIAKTIYQLLK